MTEFKPDRGLRTVAVFEGIKGGVALFSGLIILFLIRKHDLPVVINDLVGSWHLRTDHPLLERLIALAGMVTPENMLLLSGLAVGYSVIRFAEAWGLWRSRVWAEWLGILSGGIYLPAEIYEIYRHPGVLPVVVFLVNVLIIAYLVLVRLRGDH